MHQTTDLGEATFIRLRGHPVTIKLLNHGHTTFIFPLAAKDDALAYSNGALIPARDFAKTERQLKNMAHTLATKGYDRECQPAK